MNIGIIGAGWFGCYVAEYLLENYSNISITLIDKNSNIFEGSSYNNQNRLHLGFHYPRCEITRIKCKNNFKKFIKKYYEFIEPIDKNYYIISKFSNLSYNDFIKLYNFDDYKLIKNNFNITNIEGNILNVNEMFINYKKVKDYFNSKLKKNKNIEILLNYEVQNVDVIDKNIIIINNEKKFNKLFICTYNQTNELIKNLFKNITNDIIYEKCLTLIYKKIDDVPFNCLTIMDGNFSSIYYYSTNEINNTEYYTLTDVKNTPLIKSSNINNVYNFNAYDLNEKVLLFEKNLIDYYPDFKKKFEFYSHYESLKCKNNSINDSRDINININDKQNIVNIWCGKLSFIFEINDIIDKIINI